MEGAELNAEVSLNGTAWARRPSSCRSPSRAGKIVAWPRFNLSVVVPAKYKSESRVIDYAGGTSLAFKLQPITRSRPPSFIQRWS